MEYIPCRIRQMTLCCDSRKMVYVARYEMKFYTHLPLYISNNNLINKVRLINHNCVEHYFSRLFDYILQSWCFYNAFTKIVHWSLLTENTWRQYNFLEWNTLKRMSLFDVILIQTYRIHFISLLCYSDNVYCLPLHYLYITDTATINIK